MNTIAIIPARSGSTRIPLKNVKEFYGLPIIVYSIEKAKFSGLFDRIIVTTDDFYIAEIARQYGAEAHMRDPAFCLDNVGTQTVTAHCLEMINAEPGDIACCIYATAPLMRVEDLRLGYNLLTSSGQGVVDYVMSAGYPPLSDAAQFYWGRAWEFIRNAPLISHRTRLVYINPKRVCDINTMEDWDRALKMYEEL